jgi:hypothetical protein
VQASAAARACTAGTLLQRHFSQSFLVSGQVWQVPRPLELVPEEEQHFGIIFVTMVWPDPWLALGLVFFIRGMALIRWFKI